MAQSSELTAVMGLEQLAFTEHSGQLYYNRSTYGSGLVGENGIGGTIGRAERMADYWQSAAPFRNETVFAGLEVDADFAGNPVAETADLERADIVVGAVHWLQELRRPQSTCRQDSGNTLRSHW